MVANKDEAATETTVHRFEEEEDGEDEDDWMLLFSRDCHLREGCDHREEGKCPFSLLRDVTGARGCFMGKASDNELINRSDKTIGRFMLEEPESYVLLYVKHKHCLCRLDRDTQAFLSCLTSWSFDRLSMSCDVI